MAEAVEQRIDTIAERAVQLGGVAHGTIQNTHRKTTLPVYPTDIFEGTAHVVALSD
jgi:starvation-inducible DNA-binding protein